ncbi:hypothetical protein PC116_g32096 [Phytophthora cactorum]|nr:hypothetical protein PC116_g32096 [Phytophthora cactorum]
MKSKRYGVNNARVIPSSPLSSVPTWLRKSCRDCAKGSPLKGYRNG